MARPPQTPRQTVTTARYKVELSTPITFPVVTVAAVRVVVVFLKSNGLLQITSAM